MEWESKLKRAQSLKSIPSSCDKPTRTETVLRNRTTSVSQLVSRYQTTVVVSTSVQETTLNNGEVKPKPVMKEVTSKQMMKEVTSKQMMKETSSSNLEFLMLRNKERERSRAKANLTRSKSVGSLQNNTGSIETLKALFEQKGATQNNSKSSFRATSFPSAYKAADSMPVMNGGFEEVKSSAEKQKAKAPADAPANDTKAEGKDHVTRKVANQSKLERRKTIGGIDFENLAASQADEKRRSFANYRDSSFHQTKETLSISVKAMSALYLSKAAPQESNRSLKQAQEKSSEPGKKGKLTKMAEGPKQRRADLPPPSSAKLQPGPEDAFGTHSQKSMPSHLTKEELHEQRQKCELRRLLKHTHPELKMLDEVVDEELAEVLGSEFGGTAGETGYEGEVLSRRLLFENCAFSNRVSPHSHKMHMAERTVERGDVNKTPAVSEEHGGNKNVQGINEGGEMLGSSQENAREGEEEMIRMDVQATRRKFENQSAGNTSILMPDKKYQHNLYIYANETRQVQKQEQQFEMGCKESQDSQNKSNICSKISDSKDHIQIHKQGPSVDLPGQGHQFSGMEQASFDENALGSGRTSLPDPEKFDEIIKTSAALIQNNPFIPTNIEKEHLYVDPLKSQRVEENSMEAQNYPVANVKNRTHVFESLPFHQIRQQNQDEIESMVENIKETLNSLYHVNAIHSGGSIIEVNETMLAKKAKFTLSEEGPEIKYDEVAEGGAQNFILQLLPRAKLKPQVTYLKESSNSSMEVTVVNVPLHKRQYTTHPDTEFKTANVVQVVEDILNQDNSLRKGVIFHEDTEQCTEVVVYSLYKYFDKDNVKCYCPPQGAKCDNLEPEKGEVDRTDNWEPQRGFVGSAISFLLETSNEQSCQGSTRPDVAVKGNVRLFKSCIEKGDLEYLKSLQAEPTLEEQEVPPNQNVAGHEMDFHHEQRDDQVEEGTPEWVPVDVKRLKNMFSKDGGPVQPRQNRYLYENHTKSVCSTITSQNVSSGKGLPALKCNIGVLPDGQVKEVLKATDAQPQTEPYALPVAPQGQNIRHKSQDGDMVHQAELVEVVEDNDEITDLQAAIQSLQLATTEAKYLHQSSQEKNKFLDQGSFKKPVISGGHVKLSRTEDKDSHSEELQTTETCSKVRQESKEVVQKQHFQSAPLFVDSSETTAPQQDDEEVVFQGKLKAALNSLERSNINVTRGDFRAAMIYRNSPKPHKGQPQSGDGELVQKTNKELLSSVTDRPAQEPVKQEVTKRQLKTENLEPSKQSEAPNKPSSSADLEKNRRPTGAKPVIPPKPGHLKLKQRAIQSTNSKNPETAQSKTTQSKETVPQPPVSPKNDHQRHQLKMSSGANLGLDLEDHWEDEHVDEVRQMSHLNEERIQVQGSVIALENYNLDKTLVIQQEVNTTVEVKSPQDVSNKDSMGETDESHVDFQGACQKFESKKEFTVKSAPVKPKRVKMTQSGNKNPKHMSGVNNSSTHTHVVKEPQQNRIDPLCSNPNACGQTADSKDKLEKTTDQEGKVEMRGKRGRTETEDERRQRLSVHMDEIMRGNITAAMEIFDNLRKQEELKCILSRVEETDQDTSDVDVSSLRKVFENVPDWVVSSNKNKLEKEKVKNKVERLLPSETRDNTDSKSSMAHVFGDLERASEEIMNLKEQTLARLLDIEETIKKALYSVSTLKSDSDIAGLSSLFKESLGTVPGSPSSGNIKKISIGSSKIKSQPTKDSPAVLGNTALPVDQHSGEVDVSSAKQRGSPPSSPAFISIQSAARKMSKEEMTPQDTTICAACQQNPKKEEKYRTTKTLTCNSPAQNRKKAPRKRGKKKASCDQRNPKQELSVLDVHSDPEGNGLPETKTVTENYERTDSFGNRFYSSKTSTVVTTQPDTATSTSLTVATPATHEVTTYPEVRLPINQKR